jgi:hypothetical protein
MIRMTSQKIDPQAFIGRLVFYVSLLYLGFAAAVGAKDTPVNHPQTPLFGDTHLHSSWSTDAGMGGASLGPEVAYRASRGDRVTSHTGLSFQLDRPLDFVVLADHAENLGLADFLRRSDPLLLNNATGKRWHDWLKAHWPFRNGS